MSIKTFENDLDEKDLDKLNQLLFQLNPKLQPIGWDRITDLMKRGFVFSARDTDLTKSHPCGDLVGMITLIPILKLAASFGNIEDFVVLEDYRGRGIGNSLIREAIGKAESLGLEHLFLTSNKQRVVAREIYRKYGFEEYDSTPFKLIINGK